jgi:hypothetical protein
MRFFIAFALVFLAAATRLLPHPDNFAPIGAMSLFGAAYIGDRRLALAIPLLGLFLSDLFLNNVVYRAYFDGFTLITSWWIYAAFAAVFALGYFTLRGRKFSAARTAGVSVAGSLLFFAVTNFEVWLSSNMYPHTPAGLTACYVAALPFLQNGILGDLFFCGVLFGVYEWAARRVGKSSVV